jgi:CubicO group peptidase (beta-lactamase class C family)
VPERSGKAITLLDLSTHRSGLPSLPSNLKLNLTEGEIKDAVNLFAFYGVGDLYQFLSGYTLRRDPGAEFEYSNLGAGLLGHLLANRAGTDYESVIRSRITQPLNMPDTAMTSSFSMKQRTAIGHRASLAPLAQGDWDPSHALAGAGALRSSTNDMLTFLEAFLGYTDSPLAPAMKAMLDVRRPAGQMQIGLAWLIHSTHGREIAFHDGATAGFRSFVGYDPKERIGVVVLANASTRVGVNDIGLHLLNPKLPLANPEPPTERTEISIDPTLLDNYTGRYQVKPELILDITRDGDRLFAQGFAQFNGQAILLPKFEVFAEGEKSFFAKVSDQQIVFETGPDGRATSLVLHTAGREMPGPRMP